MKRIDKEKSVFTMSRDHKPATGQIVDPLVTVRMEFPVSILEKYNYKML